MKVDMAMLRKQAQEWLDSRMDYGKNDCEAATHLITVLANLHDDPPALDEWTKFDWNDHETWPIKGGYYLVAVKGHRKSREAFFNNSSYPRHNNWTVNDKEEELADVYAYRERLEAPEEDDE